MFTQPTITEALVKQHRSELISQARVGRLAQTARHSRPRHQSRPNLVVRALSATAVTAALAGAAFLATGSGSAPAVSGNANWSHYQTGKWASHYQSGTHRFDLADVHFAADVHWRSGRFGAGHVFGGRWA